MAESKLFKLCIECRWDDVLDLIQSNPSEAGEMLDTGKRGAAQISALQVVLAHPKCRGSVPIRIIIALLRAAPNLPSQKHLYTGNFPLHAVFYNAFFSASKRKIIAELIFRAFPPSLTLKNNDGRTALHTNCSQHCNYAPIVSLVQAAPETARMVDNNGDLPLHLACRSQKSPLKSIRVLWEVYPEGIFCRNQWGMRPFDVAKTCALGRAKLVARLDFLSNLAMMTRDMAPPEREVRGLAVRRMAGDSSRHFESHYRIEKATSSKKVADKNHVGPKKRRRCHYETMEMTMCQSMGGTLMNLKRCHVGSRVVAVAPPNFVSTSEDRSPCEERMDNDERSGRMRRLVSRAQMIDRDCAEILVSMSNII